MDKFATLQEIIEIYCISRKLVRDILRRYSIDCYKEEKTIYIDLKGFYKVYTSKYNPALFTIEEKIERAQKPIIKQPNRTLFSFFTKPVSCKQELRNLVMAYAD